MCKNVLWLIFSLLLPVPGFSGSLGDLASKFRTDIKDPAIKLAVMDFSSLSGNNAQDPFVIRERLTTFLVKNTNMTIIERALLEKVFQEQKLQLSGAVSSDGAKKIGKLLGADAIVSGTINELNTDEIEVNARVIEVETGKIITAGLANIKKDWKDIKPLNQTESGKVIADSAQDYYQRGYQYYEGGKYNIAIEFYNKAIKLKPDYLEAYNDRGIIYFIKGDYDKVITDLSQVLDLKLDYPEAYMVRARAYSAKSDYTNAIDDLNKAIELSPINFPELYFQRGLAYDGKGDQNKAIIDYSKAIELNPSFGDAYNLRGLVYYAKSDYDKAILDFTKAINLSQANLPNLYIERGVAYDDKGDKPKAIADYSKTIEFKPDYTQAYKFRSKIFCELKQYDKAIADYDALLRLDPSNADVYFLRAVAYRLNDENEKAVSDYKKAITLMPQKEEQYFRIFYGNTQDIEVYKKQGYAYEKNGDYSKAIQEFTKAINADPKNALFYARRGNAYKNLGNREDATADFETVMKLLPEDDATYLYAVYSLQAMYAKAKK